MRCEFCGWDNPQGKLTCEKCNKPLRSGVLDRSEVRSESVSFNNSRPTDRQVEDTVNLKATVREDSQQVEGICPECGYKLENGECPSCGFPKDLRKTRRPLRKKSEDIEEKSNRSFKLIPISEETGKPEGEELLFEEENVILNRDNTDSNNPTITSDQQANIVFEDGVWGIEDKSNLRTTFVQASSRIELHDGDLILLGNQLYRFES